MRRNLAYFLIALFCCCAQVNSFSQVELTIEDDNEVVLVQEFNVKNSFLALNMANELLVNFRSQGYITSFFDTILKSDDKIKLILIKGKRYRWDGLKIDEKLKPLWKFDKKAEGILDVNQLQSNILGVLAHYENSGYPFAQIYFDSISFKDSTVSARLNCNKNQLIIIDSVIVKGGSKMSVIYLSKWLGINKGMRYNQELILEMNRKLRNLDLVKIIRDPEVFFTPGSAQIVLYLEDNSSNRFDGILGLNPNEKTGKIEVIGELKVDLNNAFKRGERIFLNWEKVKSNSQNFKVDFSYPFLFKTRFGLQTQFNYFRQDTSFANLRGVLGLSYFINDQQEFSINAEIVESNSLIDNSELAVIPTFNSVSTVYYGVGYKLNTLDYRINPRKGWSLSLGVKTGRKTIIKNPEIESVNYQELAETTRQLKADVSVSLFLPIFKRSAAHFQLQSGNLIGDNVFVNELYQIGGSKTLRGFNQQSILASNYYVLTTEYRYLFSRNSNLFGFLDLGFYENNSIDFHQKDTPFGFGLGINFQTNAGIFSLSYGLGAQQDNPILVKNGKVHFGFVSLF